MLQYEQSHSFVREYCRLFRGDCIVQLDSDWLVYSSTKTSILVLVQGMADIDSFLADW
jgi:hypothetical protein